MLAGSLLFSLAFNMRWAWGSEFLSVLAAAACTLIVPGGIHLWPGIRVVTWWHRALRFFLLGGICATAAVTSFSHSVSVLIGAGWSEFTAWSVTGGAELLVALSTMAVRFPALLNVEDASVAAEPEAAVEPEVATKPEVAAPPVIETPALFEPERVESGARVVPFRSAEQQSSVELNLPAGLSAQEVVFALLDRAAAAGEPEPSGPALTAAVHAYGLTVNKEFGRTTRVRWRQARAERREVSG